MREERSVNNRLGKHWTDYWRQGNLTSLPRGFAGNYDGEFLAFWEARFAGLPQGARVLDVCSGNGAIALLACEYSQRHGLDLQVSATDAAGIDASRVVAAHPHLREHLESIRFIGGVPLEDVEGEPGALDLVTSQFGVEYSLWERSAENIHRILKPGGHFAMICHSADSRILQAMELQHADYEQIMSIELLSRDIEGDLPPANFAMQLEQALAGLYQLFQSNRASQLLSAAGGRLESIRELASQQPEAGWREFARFCEGISASHGIAGDLLAVNRAVSNSPTWYEAFTRAGLTLLESGTIHYRTGEKAGDCYRFSKPA